MKMLQQLEGDSRAPERTLDGVTSDVQESRDDLEVFSLSTQMTDRPAHHRTEGVKKAHKVCDCPESHAKSASLAASSRGRAKLSHSGSLANGRDPGSGKGASSNSNDGLDHSTPAMSAPEREIMARTRNSLHRSALHARRLSGLPGVRNSPGVTSASPGYTQGSGLPRTTRRKARLRLSIRNVLFAFTAALLGRMTTKRCRQRSLIARTSLSSTLQMKMTTTTTLMTPHLGHPKTTSKPKVSPKRLSPLVQ